MHQRDTPTMDDLFSDQPLVANVTTGSPARIAAIMLPRDLAGALRTLDDDALARLREAVEAEAQRRAPPANSVPVTRTESPPPSKTERVGPAAASAVTLAPGKLRLIRAAAAAGIKPTAIAKQFGVTLATVRAALDGA